MDRDFFKTQLQRRLVTSVPDDDHAVRIGHEWLSEAELADRRGHRLDSIIVEDEDFSHKA